MTAKTKNKFNIRYSEEVYKELVLKLEDYLDDLTLENPGDGEELLEILADYGVSIEKGENRDSFILCGVCGGVLYKTLNTIYQTSPWIFKCVECGKEYNPLLMSCMNRTKCKELIKEEGIVNSFDAETEEKIKGEYLQDVNYVCGPGTFDKEHVNLLKKGR